MFNLKSLVFTASALVASVAALGSSCSSPLGSGTAGAGDPFWLQDITHQGTSPFNSNPSSYTVFRNVQDYGAKGDGVTDDTAAINAAISDGGRCGDQTCDSSTTSPAVVFFPQGTYVVSTPIIAYYDTVLVGDARVPPTLSATAGFAGIAVIDADPYGNGGANWYVNQDNFFRSVRNFVIDLTNIPATSGATGLHWQVSQSTSLINIVVNMSTESDTVHQGIFMENGSGGFLGDIIFNGGKYGFWSGNQQFTVRNITVNNAQVGILADWNWGWTFQGVTFNDCQIGFMVETGGTRGATTTVGAEAIIDAVVSNTPVFIQLSEVPGNPLSSGSGSIVINNIQLNNVPTAVNTATGTTLLAGGSTTISEWVLGNVFTGSSSNAQFTTGTTTSFSKPASLVNSAGEIFGRGHPQYEDYAVDQFISVKTTGAKGDGVTDDTAALNAVFAQYSGCKIIFFDAGVYYITDTLVIPAGSQIVGEAWSQILAGGSNFQSQSSPTVAVQVGSAGSSGTLEITDIVFSTKGPAPGAIMVEWNVAETTQGGAGMWDTHFRFGGAAGTNMQSGCSNTTSTIDACTAGFLALHITSGATAYLEGTWIWTADHDLDGGEELTIYTGRGLLSESAGPVWLIGVASEHQTLYQFNLNGAADHYMGLLQTETPYYQPNPAPPAPFSSNSAYNDPTFSSALNDAWALYISNSQDITVFGAGFYNFFEDYATACETPANCQSQIVNVDTASSGIAIYSLSTVSSTFSLSVGEVGVVNQDQIINGFASTVTKWTSS